MLALGARGVLVVSAAEAEGIPELRHAWGGETSTAEATGARTTATGAAAASADAGGMGSAVTQPVPPWLALGPGAGWHPLPSGLWRAAAVGETPRAAVGLSALSAAGDEGGNRNSQQEDGGNDSGDAGNGAPSDLVAVFFSF